MNPFSGFLQPPQQRSPLAGAGEFMTDLSRLNLSRQQEANRVREASTDNARADQSLKLQQTDQASRLGQQDQKQVEALLAEYQDAEDQGDPIRLSRAAQMLKRFGMDVSQGKVPALAGALPSPASLQQQEVDLSQEEFEEQLVNGPQAGAYAGVIETELASREALKKRNAAEEPDIAGHLDAVSGLKPLKLNTREEQDASGPIGPDEEYEDVPAVPLGQVDMDLDEPATRKAARDEQRPELKNTAPPQLSGGLPTVVSRGGKTLYESTGPSGRWSPMVQGVFQPFTSHSNPDIASAAERAKQVTGKLIEVDGVAPKDAIKMGMDYLNGEANRITNLARTELGTRPKWGGGGGATTGILGPKEDRAESIDKYGDNIRAALQNAGIPKSMEQAAIAESALMSGDPALQKDGLKALLLARSGLTVSEGERRSYSTLDGGLSLAQDTLAKWTGQPLAPGTVKALLSVVRNIRSVNEQTANKIAAQEKRRYEVQNRDKVAPERLKERADALLPNTGEGDEYGGL